MKPNFISLGASSAALAVALGAFGRHGFRGKIDFRLWDTATRYLVLGALGMVLFGLFQQSSKRGGLAGWLLLGGSALFASSLYALALGGPRILGAITPFGGAGLIAGFVCFALSARQR